MCLYKARKGMVNWSHICNDILLLIMFKLSAPEDIVHFGAVCRQWRSVSVENRHLLNKSVVVPWLMLADQEDSDRRCFYSLSTQKVYHLNLPEARSIRQCWSSQGWLITLGLDWEYQLLNPVSRALIRLPSQPTFIHDYYDHDPFIPNFSLPDQINLDRNMFIEKMVLSSPPSPSVENDEKCMVMAITYKSGQLSFLRLGDEVWRAIEDEDGPLSYADDVISFNDQFYAIDRIGELYICDISSVEPKFILFAEEGVFSGRYYMYEFEVYLVESEGELFSVSRSLEWDGDIGGLSTVGFYVFKLNFDKRTWTKVKSLENRALFVGNVCSFAIFSNDHPGFELNCIYFDHNAQGVCIDDKGVYVFRMETKEIESLGLDFFSGIHTPPLWICPSL